MGFEQTASVRDNSTPEQAVDAVCGREVRLPGEMSMWVFVLGDMVIFAMYFIVYMVERAREPAVFLASQQDLNQNIGLLNTVLMLTSSWFVARSVLAARSGNRQQTIRLVEAGGLCGILFILLKAYEWWAEISHGHTVATDQFFTWYFILTGVHLIHVVVGLIILTVVLRDLRRPLPYRVSLVESGATFWHMVDLVWIVIFALIYVMR
jgi:nitric oxide reductase NorE protein